MTDHWTAEEHQTESGWRVLCACGCEVNRGSLEDARSDLRGHIEVSKLRAALKREEAG